MRAYAKPDCGWLFLLDKSMKIQAQNNFDQSLQLLCQDIRVVAAAASMALATIINVTKG